jgi:AsmA family/AsmA-like C-terminal region
MSVWKSPIFYFGIVLVLVILGALVAPFVINWNSYRDNLEAWGHNVTGRQVAINGPIAIRLFPWPRLEAADVSVANPQGFGDQAMLNAKRITVQLTLAGLFDGDVQVEAITIDEAHLFVARNSEGQGNWNFKLGQSRWFSKVKLDQIKINEGTISLHDEEQAFDTAFEHVNGVISAAALEGPWRVRGTAQNGNLPLDITFTSSVWKADEPFKFGARFTPSDGSLPAFSFDGAEDKGGLKGKLMIEPVITDDGRQSLNAAIKPLQLQADVTASFKGAKFEKIRITPVDTKDSGTLIEGSADLAFERGIDANLTLTSPRLDLDHLAGGQSLRVWRAGGLMALLNQVIAQFPERLDLTADFDVSSLSVAGDTLGNVKLSIAAQQGAVRIQNLSAQLPGRTAMKFDGIAFPGTGAAELGGTLALESNDTRALVSWLWPEGKARLAKIWTGSRGRLKAQSDVTWSGKRFGFQNLNYEMDGEGGKAELAVAIGKLPSIDLKLQTPNLDLENYLSLSTADLLAGAISAPASAEDAGFDKRIAIDAKALHFNGVTAQDVTVDFSSSYSGFEVKALNIGSVEGAQVKGQGLVLQGPDGPTGDVKLSVLAENPRGLLRLVGAFPKGPDPFWASALGRTNMKADLTVRPGAHEPKITFGANGTSGSLKLSGTGEVKELSLGKNANVGLAAEIETDDSSDLVRLAGYAAGAAGTGAGKLTFTSTGSAETGYDAVFHGDAFGLSFGVEGRAKLAKSGAGFVGAANITGDNGEILARVLGLSHLKVLDGAMHAKANIEMADRQINIKALTGQLGGQDVLGDGSIALDGVIDANLALEHISLSGILAGAFMTWNNVETVLSDGFSAASPAGWRGEIWLRPQDLQTFQSPLNQSRLKEAVVGLSFEQRSRAVSVASRTADGEPFELDLTLRQGGEGFVLDGSGHGRVDLAPFMAVSGGGSVATGQLALDGSFTGVGRSPLAVLSDLAGKGTYQLDNASLTEITPDPFYQQLTSVKDAAGLQQAFDGLLRGPGFALESEKHDFTITKGVAMGQAAVTALPASTAKLTPSYDFSNTQAKAEIVLTSSLSGDLPELRVTYEGALGNLARRSDTAAISAKLGYAFIARDIAELDRVKQEQEKLAADEAAQTEADQVKFAAYQAQRVELRLRLRELKVHAVQRVVDGARRKAEMDAVLAAGVAITKSEMPKYLRRLPVP